MSITWMVAFCSLSYTECILELDVYSSEQECYNQVETMYRRTGVKAYICIPVEEDKMLKIYVE